MGLLLVGWVAWWLELQPGRQIMKVEAACLLLAALCVEWWRCRCGKGASQASSRGGNDDEEEEEILACPVWVLWWRQMGRGVR